MGGVKFLQAICAPYKNVRFIPTGGIDTKNIGHYLALPQVVACGGSWMVKPELFEAGDFARVKQLAGEAVALARESRGRLGGVWIRHIGPISAILSICPICPICPIWRV